MRVCEIFASIQGEGVDIGLPQAFLRLTGCNLDCLWCDTKYARQGGEDVSVHEVYQRIMACGIRRVCVTGGEPLLQADEVRELLLKLKKNNFIVSVETNGTLYDRIIFSKANRISFDVKPPSSGQESDLGLLKKLGVKDQIKIVVAGEIDYEFAEKIVRGKNRAEVVLQPEEGGMGYEKLAERALKDRLNARVLPQLHKIYGLR
jgi:7-carboxy-7-deazaguanine synthase